MVNNNAAAVFLALNTLAEGSEVIVSRGELIEIGGSFRIPDVCAKSGAVLREVGTTNRTRAGDYAAAINERTRVLLRVHPSNFRVVGFTERPSLDELVEFAHKHNLILMEDLGSGCLVDLTSCGVRDEPPAGLSLKAGADVVTFSGDKLLGGPQAGILVGKREPLERIRGNPLFRALRVDKLTIAALEATVSLYLQDRLDSIPALRMMRLSKEQIAVRAERLAGRISAVSGRYDSPSGWGVRHRRRLDSGTVAAYFAYRGPAQPSQRGKAGGNAPLPKARRPRSRRAGRVPHRPADCCGGSGGNDRTSDRKGSRLSVVSG